MRRAGSRDEGPGPTVADAIPVMRPRCPAADQLLPYLRKIDESGRYSNFGPLTRQLEERIAEHVGLPANRVVATSNATAALMGALSIATHDDWVVPSWTFTATASAARRIAHTMRFADVDATGWWLDGSHIDDEEGRENGAIGTLQVAPFGADPTHRPSDVDQEVVVDAAASLGQSEGRLGMLAAHTSVVFSLHATKVMGAGEGGVAVFGTSERAVRCRAWTNYGFTSERRSAELGTNAKMSELAAASALAAIDGWPRERQDWQVARRWADEVTSACNLTAAPHQTGSISPYWIVVFPDAPTRELTQRLLAEHRIETRRWWDDGCHAMGAYADVPTGDLTVTKRLAQTVLGLPMYRGLDGRAADRIATAIEDVRRRARTW